MSETTLSQPDSEADKAKQLRCALNRELNRYFITAVSLGRRDDAIAALPDVDWSLIDLSRNPVALVLDEHLFTPKSQREFADRNRALVADYAAENFDYEDNTYEDDQGWEYTSHGNGRISDWTKVIYLRPAGADDEDDSKAARMTLRFVEVPEPWGPDGCALASCVVEDDAGNSFGCLPDLEEAHKKAAYGLPVEQMPAFVQQVLQWCIDAGRQDLIATPADALIGGSASESHAKFRLTGQNSVCVLAKAARMGQVDVVETAIALGCDPLERLSITDGPDQMLLEVIEKNDGASSATLIRSILARHAANQAVLELADSTRAKPGL